MNKKNVTEDAAQSSTQSSLVETVVEDIPSLSTDMTLATQSANDFTLSSSSEFMFDPNSFPLDLAVPAADSHFLILQPLRGCEAFSRIIMILNLPCSYTLKISDSTPPGTPTSLVPTREQRVIPHQMYIDILPWPSLRANILRRISTINQDEFTTDIQGDALKVWGSTPWDPMGWEVSEAFLCKWFFLLDRTILQSTNFWRGQRSEPPLTFPGNWNGVE